MAGVSDKARFYLERAAPQLRDFEQKEIFTKEEIRSLVTKRSDFEHQILAPGTKPTDFLSYVSWERSLERLRSKRCRRLHIHNSTSHASEARTFGIFERAVQKHPGCIPLWRAYLDFANEVKASKKWWRVVTRALRLHPQSGALWAMAGRRAAEKGDIKRAQGYFLRGCGFCVAEPGLWVEFARCMVQWLGRREEKKVGGVVVKTEKSSSEMVGVSADHIPFDDDEGDSDGSGDEDEVLGDAGGEAVMVLPDPDAVQIGAAVPGGVSEEEATRKLEQIPLVIFDKARTERFWGPAAAELFFELFAGFGKLSFQGRLVQHVVDVMTEMFPSHPATCSVVVRQPLVGVAVNTAAFPKVLRESLTRLKAAMEQTSDKKVLAQKLVAWIDSMLAVEEMDEAIKTVLGHTKKSLEVQGVVGR